MLRNFCAAFGDVFSKKIRGLLILTLISAVIVSAVLFFGLTAVFTHFVSFDNFWMDGFIWGVGFFVLALLLFPSIVTFLAGFFIDWGVDKLSQGCNLRDVKL